MTGAGSEQTLDLAQEVARYQAEAQLRAYLIAAMSERLDTLIAELLGPAYVGRSRQYELAAQLTRVRRALESL